MRHVQTTKICFIRLINLQKNCRSSIVNPLRPNNVDFEIKHVINHIGRSTIMTGIFRTLADGNFYRECIMNHSCFTSTLNVQQAVKRSTDAVLKAFVWTQTLNLRRKANRAVCNKTSVETVLLTLKNRVSIRLGFFGDKLC